MHTAHGTVQYKLVAAACHRGVQAGSGHWLTWRRGHTVGQPSEEWIIDDDEDRRLPNENQYLEDRLEEQVAVAVYCCDLHNLTGQENNWYVRKNIAHLAMQAAQHQIAKAAARLTMQAAQRQAEEEAVRLAKKAAQRMAAEEIARLAALRAASVSSSAAHAPTLDASSHKGLADPAVGHGLQSQTSKESAPVSLAASAAGLQRHGSATGVELRCSPCDTTFVRCTSL